MITFWTVLSLVLLGCTPSLGDSSEHPPLQQLAPVKSQSIDNGPCEANVTCLAVFPYKASKTTLEKSTATLDDYACDPDKNESGPENIYRVQIPEEGLLIAQVADLHPSTDVDVHILTQLDAASCLSRGDHTSVAKVTPGFAYVVVDSFSGSPKAGPYTLTINFVGPSSLSAHGLRSKVASRALTAFSRAWQHHKTRRLEYTVIDFSLRSTEKRLWVFDLLTGEPIFHLLVSHGSGSNPMPDTRRPTVFSNVPESHQSSLGLMQTGETYYGMWGYSLKLDGLEPVFNDNVRARHVVIHGADWAGQRFVDANNTLGMSWGCPTVDSPDARSLIDTIKNKTLVFTDYPDPDWLSRSLYLNE